MLFAGGLLSLCLASKSAAAEPLSWKSEGSETIFLITADGIIATSLPEQGEARLVAQADAKDFILENRAGAPTLLAHRRLTAEHPIEKVGAKLRDMMPWIRKNRLVDQSRN